MHLFTRSNNASTTTGTTAAAFSSSYTYRELEQTPRSTSTTTGGSGAGTSRVMYTRDWRTALRTPPTYRIGNRTVRFNYHFALLLASVIALFIFFYYKNTGSSSSSDTAAWQKHYGSAAAAGAVSLSQYTTKANSISNSNSNGDSSKYNATYPLTQPLVARGSVTYRIGMVADLDTDSKVTKSDGSTVWRSYYKKGHLLYIPAKRELKLTWDKTEPVTLESSFALKGRGMELSELVTYNGKLLTFDDRTGLIYEIENDKVIPWIILLDGNGHNAKGFKSEWATVKQQTLYVGSMGKEWTTGSGEFENENPMFVKTVSMTGEAHSLDWAYNFKLLRQQAMQIKWPGYMIHESGVWSEVHHKWFFLPRRCSNDKYNETQDEHMGCNLLITADEQFSKVEKISLDSANTQPTHGFSSFKFVPGSEDSIILAIRSEELNGKTSTFITAFDVSGKTLLPEERIDTHYKYEGLEFI